MSRDSYTTRAIVLRKTKLGESDLIVTFLGRDGSQIRAVAKGARKPTSPFAARLEICSECDMLLVRGRSLDIVKEARIASSHEAVRTDFDRMLLADCMMELLGRTTQEALEIPSLFALTHTALDALEQAGPNKACAVALAHMLKVFAFAGVRPELGRCVLCGDDLRSRREIDARSFFSFKDGGVLCSSCAALAGGQGIEPELAGWLEALLCSTFVQIREFGFLSEVTKPALLFCRNWTRMHLGFDVKAIGIALSMGIGSERVASKKGPCCKLKTRA